jgi:peptide/nickel transport system substrate-binding protein
MKTKSTILSLSLIFIMLLSACSSAATTVAPATTAPQVEEPTETSVAIQAEEATSTPAPTLAPETKYKQAPMLDELVANGTLPDVDARVSANPAVTVPVEKVGQYGGTLHLTSSDPAYGDIKMYLTDPPIKWKADLTGYEPGLAAGYEWSEDGKTFTMHLREDLKWSDGEPYTSADWQFWWEDMVNAPDQKVYSVPSYMRNADGTPINLEFPDDYTVVWQSTDRALWIDPFYLAQGFWEFADPKMKPAHFLKLYHPSYTSGKTWDDLVAADKWWDVEGYPCLMAWCFSKKSSDSTLVTLARNPYYWRVDTEGNQLPYIDTVEISIVADDQVRLLNATQGKYDMLVRGLGSPNNLPLLQEKAADGGYHILDGWMVGTGSWPGYFINQDYVEGGQNYADDTPEHAKEIRDLLRNASFRQALSIGTDRQKIIDVAWKGIGTTKQYTLSPQSWHFAGAEGQKVYEEWAASFTEYDVAKANEMLDEIGMTKGADGFRTLPSGTAFDLIIDVTDWGGDLAVNVDGSNELKAQWEANLGIKTTINNLQGQPISGTRMNEGFYMLKVAEMAEVDIWTFPEQIFPVRNNYSFPLTGRWYANGGDTCVPSAPEKQYAECGMKPEPGSPEARLQDIYRQGLNTKDIDARHQLVWDAFEINMTEGPFILGLTGDVPAAAICKDNLKNVLNYGVTGPWAPATPGNQVTAQWYFEQ